MFNPNKSRYIYVSGWHSLNICKVSVTVKTRWNIYTHATDKTMQARILRTKILQWYSRISISSLNQSAMLYPPFPLLTTTCIIDPCHEHSFIFDWGKWFCMNNVSIYEQGCLLRAPYSHRSMTARWRATFRVAREVDNDVTKVWQRYRDDLGSSYIYVCLRVFAGPSDRGSLVFQFHSGYFGIKKIKCASVE